MSEISKHRLIDGDKLLKDLREDCELMKYTDVISAIESDRYNIPSDQGETTRLRKTLERIKGYATSAKAGNMEKDWAIKLTIAACEDSEAVSSHTEGKGEHVLRSFILENFGSIEINETPRDEIILMIAALLDKVR
jgi:hypothetical protein